MKRVVAALFILFSLPVFKFGADFLWSALKLHSGQPFYAPSRDAYAEYGLIWVGISLLILAPSATVLLKKDSKGSWLVLPLLVLLLVAVALPSNLPPGYRGRLAGRAVERRMERAGESLKSWAGEHRQFPEDENQLRTALEPREPGDEESQTNSRYQRGGQPLAYQFVFVGNAQGPHRPQPPGGQPAIVYCAMSPDRQKFWITATALPDDVSSNVVMLERDSQLVVISGEVLPKTPEPVAAPAPGKKAGKK
ncbi:MAG: hypothetical protein ACRD3A_05745 [Terriglobales bacterium]